MHAAPARIAAVLIIGLSLAGCGVQAGQPARAVDARSAPARAQDLADCMGSAGFDVYLTYNNGVATTPIPKAQKSAYRAAMAECSESTHVDDRVFTSKDIHAIYALELAQRECLQRKGFAVTDPPSLQSYVDSFDTADRWFAMSDIDPATMDREAYEELFTECPSPWWTY
jgi:hypothetical protein